MNHKDNNHFTIHSWSNMNLTVQELHEKLKNKENFLLIDVREKWEHDTFNVGGTLLPIAELMNRMWELEDYKDKEVVVYCQSGNRSGMAQHLLKANGFQHVYNVTGGMGAWVTAFGKEKPGA